MEQVVEIPSFLVLVENPHQSEIALVVGGSDLDIVIGPCPFLPLGKLGSP